ncbi:MAG: hypothetical protein EOO07_09445 [Chitinophagaceae bacterium]|nr:MAG: hypothetical protein EOO07_09445 [Chitinophagaceae bacterium]
MYHLILIVMFLLSKTFALSPKIPEDFGYRHIKLKYLDDPVDAIIISKPGEEKTAKPLLLFCQDTLPQPVVKYDENGLYNTLPFDETQFLENYHILIISKPHIPIIANINKLDKNYNYFKDVEKQLPPKAYTDRNYLEYYVYRNNAILKQLFKERWVKTNQLLVVGYGEGSTIAAKMASINKKITHLIYANGNPYGRITTILAQNPETTTASNLQKEHILEHWKKVVANPTQIQYDGGDTYKATYSFSQPQRDNLIQLKIPVLINYNINDIGVAYQHLFQVEAIQHHKHNITFCSYASLRNPIFQMNKIGTIPEEQTYCNTISNDWLEWLKSTEG